MLIILNHKSNFKYEEIIKYEKQIRKMNVIVLPSTCYLPIFRKGKYKLGSQDISEFKEKSLTGEIIGEQLNSLNIKYCLIGHSERRQYNKESNNTIIDKINNCISNNIIPIYCIGEMYDEDRLNNQIDLVLKKYNNEILLAYEPIENIGKDNPNLDKVEETINYIKNYIKDKYNKNIKLIYGGGVNKDNINKIKNIKNIDGILLSTESLNIKHLKTIYKECM